MDIAAVLAFATLLGIVAGLGAYVFLYSKQQAAAAGRGAGGGGGGAAADTEDVVAGARRGGGAAANRLRRQLRQRHAAQQQQQQAAAVARGDSDASQDSDEAADEEPLDRRGRRRAERAEERAAAAAAREAKDAKINAYEERRKKKDDEREARERAQEEEVRRAAEEKQRAEDEEAAKWMNMISVEQTGTVEEAAAAEDQGLLSRFIDYVISRKTVPVEEAAAAFGLRSSEVVDRLQGLEAMGRISGVMDERGKFIYISVEEMEAFAAHIRRAGRVSIAALAAASNDLIDLAPRTDDGDGPAGLAPPPGPALDFDTLAAGGLEPVAA